MHQLIVAAVTLLCASSISGLGLLPRTDAGARGFAASSEQTLPPVASPPPNEAQNAPATTETFATAPEPELGQAVAGILAQFEGRHTQLSRRDLRALAQTIVRQAQRHGLDPALVMAVIKVESGGYNLAVSHVGALGLMQLMPATGEELARKHGVAWSGEESLFDPIVNVKLGTAYLKQLADKYDGDIQVALAAYNWGPGRIDRFLHRGSPLPTEYIQRVMQSYTVAAQAS